MGFLFGTNLKTFCMWEKRLFLEYRSKTSQLLHEFNELLCIKISHEFAVYLVFTLFIVIDEVIYAKTVILYNLILLSK